MDSQDRLFLSTLAISRRLVGGVIKQLLRLDPQIVEHLAPLEGKLFAVEIHELPLFFIRVKEGEAQFMWETNESPDGTIRAGLFSIVHTQSQTSRNLNNWKANYEVLGDTNTKREVQKFFSTFEIDWEERLSGIIGDTMAHKGAKGARLIASFSRNASYSLMQNFSEYLKEERQMLVAHPRIERHRSEVALLQESVNALEARLDSLNCQTE